MRFHAGAHNLRGHCAPANGTAPLNAEACGFYGNVRLDRNCGICKVDLVNDANKNILLVESNCPFAYKMSYRAVEKGSVANPSPTDLCHVMLSTTGTVHHYVWRYHYLDHMQSIRPGQKLTGRRLQSVPSIKRST